MKHISHCLLCGSEESRPFYDFGAPDRIPVHNRICSNCGLVFQSPRPDFDELRRYYEGYITETQPGLVDIPISFEEHVLSIAGLRLKFLGPYLRKGDRVLDIGCSFGAMLKVLKDESGRELNLIGVNPEPGVAEFGIRHYGLDIRVGMFEDIDFDAESFNLVILDNVIEHFADPRRSVRSIRKLLAPDGRFFIATNNLDEPHGFLWQNFFPDHTVTFSTGTLRALLESEGFTILEHDTSGHVTYTGYHYPYQLCIAAKAEAPDAYDFHKRGDSAEARLVQAQKYIKSTYRENGLAKRAYERKLHSSAGPVARLKTKAIELLASVSGRATDFQIQNHTLPTEEYFYRRVLLAECATDEDVALALRTVRKSGINPEVIILRPAGREQFMVQCRPQFLSDRKRPSKPVSRKSIWRWALQNYPHVDEGIALRFNNADVREDVLLRLYKAFRNGKSEHCMANYGFFTSARFEFLKRESLEKLGADLEGEEDFLVPVTGDKKAVMWPQREDYCYYFKDQFDRYFSVPRSISMDLNPACNKRCDKCQFHSPRSPYAKAISSMKIMPVDLAFRILREASEWDPKPAIAPTFSGEPLIYPHLHKFLDYAKELGFCVSIATNGVALTPEEGRYLLDVGVDSIIISLDAFSDQTYDLLQAPGGLGRVRDNIIRFLDLRGEQKTPAVGLHFVMEERNKDEFADYLEFWGAKVDYVSRAILQDQFANSQCTLPHFLSPGRRQACFAAWLSLNIRSNGDISFCGFDIDGKQSGLNVTEHSLQEIWNSDALWRWRNAQLTADRSVLYCKACPDWSGQHCITTHQGNWRIVRSPIQEIYYRNEHMKE